MRLKNEFKTEPLRPYLVNYLKNYKLTNIFTGQTYSAWDILDRDHCYFLKSHPPYNYKFVKSIKFATEQKYFGNIYEEKSVQKVKKKKVTKTEPIIYTSYEYRYKYKTVTVLEPIIKRRKIGKKFYWTTQYIEVKRRKRTKPKLVPVYTIQTRTVTGYKSYKVTEIEKALKYIYRFYYYIPLYLFEKYAFVPKEGYVDYETKNKKFKRAMFLDDYELKHTVYIEPFYLSKQFVQPIGNDISEGNGLEFDGVKYSTPEEIHDLGLLNASLDYAKQAVEIVKPRDYMSRLKDRYKKMATKNIRLTTSYKGHYSYSLSVLDLVYFMDYASLPYNKQIEDVTSGKIWYETPEGEKSDYPKGM